MNILASTLFAVSFVNFESMKGTKGANGALHSSLTHLYRFLKSIFATDDTLKSLSSLAQRIPQFKASKEITSVPTATEEEEDSVIKKEIVNKIDINIIKELWSTFAHEKLEFISNGLFDDYSSILFIKKKNNNLKENNDNNNNIDPFDFKVELKQLRQLFLENLNYSVISDTTYIKYLTAHKTGQHSFPSFCILRLVSITNTLIWSRLVFVNVKYPIREKLIQQHLSIKFEFKLNQQSYLIQNCQRPLHNLLVQNEFPKKESYLNRQSLLPSFAIGYLKYFTKEWLIELNLDNYFINNNLPSIYDLVYFILLKAKLSQGFIKIGEYEDESVLFYKEFNSPWKQSYRQFGIQYKINKDFKNNQVTSEIWSEPINNEQLEDVSLNASMEILAKDECIITNLISFDLIHQACRNKKNLLNDKLRLRSLVLNSVALISTYKIPKFEYNLQVLIELEKDISFLKDKSYFIPNLNENSIYPLKFNLTEEELMNLNSLTIQCLFFQFFIETSIMKLTDTAVAGEIKDPCNIPVNQLKGLDIISPEMASQKWGFAKLISSTSFALTFVPNIIDVLLSFQKYIQNNGSNNESLKLKLWSFECIRENNTNSNQFSLNLSKLNEIQFTKEKCYNNLYPIIPTNEKLVSIMTELERVEFWTKWSQPQPNICLQVHKLQSLFDNLIGRCFVQSIYSSMLLNYKMDIMDVNMALKLCFKVEIEIDITNYLNLKTEKDKRNFNQLKKQQNELQFQQKFEKLIYNHFNLFNQQNNSNNEQLIYYLKSLNNVKENENNSNNNNSNNNNS
ncbi:hypothetical protein K502DRAFT_214620, partial [Neoconidiobolus thromboides FSU 785]